MVTRDDIKQALDTMVMEPRTEAAFLHTVSYLEFVGARKISKTVASKHPSLEVLDHLADETRHAFAFKKLAVHIGGADSDLEYLNLDPAKRMFHSLDTKLSAWVTAAVGADDEYLNYLLVTTMIERRAMQLYPLYRAATQSDTVRAALSEIIVEEQNHRILLEERCVAALAVHGLDLAPALAIEAEAFSMFWRTLEVPAFSKAA